METKRRKIILHRVIERLDTRIDRLASIRNRLQRLADSLEEANVHTARESD